MKKLAVVAAGLSMMGSSLALSTVNAGEYEISGNVALTTNYVFRGLSQTDDGPAIQGGFDVGKGGFYAGTWASSVDFGDDTTMEIDFYGGYAGSITENTSFDVGVIYYAYPDSPGIPGDQDFYEVYGGVSHAFGAVELGASVAYSPDFYGETDESVYTLLSGSFAPADNISLDVTYGFSEFDNDLLNTDYQDFSVGGTYSCDSGIDLSLTFYGTNELTDDTETLVFAIGKSL